MAIRAPFFSNQSMLGPIFAQICRKFVKVLRFFLNFFVGFCPDFHQIKTFGDAVAPPASYTSVCQV